MKTGMPDFGLTTHTNRLMQIRSCTSDLGSDQFLHYTFPTPVTAKKYFCNVRVQLWERMNQTIF